MVKPPSETIPGWYGLGPLHPGPSYFGCYGPDARAPVAGKNFVRHGCSHLPTIAIVFVEKIGFVSHIPPRVTDAAVVAAITATSRPKTFSHPVLRNEPNFLLGSWAPDNASGAPSASGRCSRSCCNGRPYLSAAPAADGW